MKATRNANNGGAPNLLFIEAAIEDLPEELKESADDIYFDSISRSEFQIFIRK